MNRFSLQNIIILLLSCQLHMRFYNANNRLKPGDFISFNDTLVSDGGMYALGFFSPTNSTTNLYVGIWFYGLPQRTVVWVANREDPVKDPAARFQISNDTNLVIVNSKRTVLWSSNLRGFGLPGEDTQVLLHHNGNLILKQGSNATLWQSFDYATDTLVPDMKLGINYKKHTVNRLISWRSEVDPSPGNFTFGVDPQTNLQLFSWHGLEPYWRSAPLTNNFYLQVKVQNTSAVYYQFTKNSDEVYFLITVSDDSIRVRATLDSLGNIKVLVWSDSKQEWVNTRTQPQYKCDRYASCSPFGYCNRVGNVPSCKCLEGFEPKVQSEWNNTNYKGGCVRKKQLQCGNANSFLRMTDMKLPDKFIYLENSSSDCEAECRRNCSCTAYAYNNSTLRGALDQFCLVWMGELLDSETATKLVPGQDLYLRIADSKTGTSSRKGKAGKTGIAFIIIPVAAAIISFICVFLLWILGRRIRELFRKQNKDGLQDSGPSIKFRNWNSDEIGESDPKQTPELQVLDFETIAFSTGNFSDLQAIGQGGFGKVYKGKLPDGQNIAVKRLTRDSGQGVEEFKNEITLIAKLQHRNLVRLFGCCIQGEERLLVYEYMPNKSLDFFLFDPAQKAVLDWEKRFDIIKGISRALLYLHQDSRLKIIHRDLKASNILLDEDMTAKVSDFGLARIVARNQEQTNTNRVVGTYGYMSPEYAMEGLFSVKSDVYSFGVLVLEILSGLKNIGFHLVMDFPNLLSYAWKLWNENKAAEFVDISIRETCSLHEANKCMYVGLLCVQDLPEDRPTMSRVVFMLENDVKINAELSQPVFTARRNLGLEGVDPASYSQEVHCTTNYLTNTMVEGR